MEHLVELLLYYKYLIILPLSIIEGPIVTLICGFLVAQKILNPFVLILVVMIGDVIGDTIAYSLGRFGGAPLLNRFGGVIGATKEKLEEARGKFHSSRKRTIILSKLIHGVGIAGLITAGSFRIPYFEYMVIALGTTLFQSSILLVLGMVFGHAYLQFDRYLGYYGVIGAVLVVAAILYFILKKKHTK